MILKSKLSDHDPHKFLPAQMRELYRTSIISNQQTEHFLKFFFIFFSFDIATQILL
jgi:hypothetical protein